MACHAFGGPAPENATALALSTASRHPAIALAVAKINLQNEPVSRATILLYLIVLTVITVPYVARQHHSPVRVRRKCRAHRTNTNAGALLADPSARSVTGPRTPGMSSALPAAYRVRVTKLRPKNAWVALEVTTWREPSLDHDGRYGCVERLHRPRDGEVSDSKDAGGGWR